jgi:chromosome segregation ATPase
MNRRLQLFNLFGVLALAALCVAQWRSNRQLNIETNQLEKTRQAQQQTISRQEQTARGLDEDLTRFKEQVAAQRGDLDDAKKKLRETESAVAGLTAERNELRESVTNWASAVSQRDALAKEANSQILELSTNLNASIQKYNELATNYNATVQELNEARTKSGVTNSP